VSAQLREAPRRPTLTRVTPGSRLRWLVAVLGGAAACGPSFQMVYECDVRFEHCYALDQGAGPPEGKKDCWRDWLHGYTYGQSRDRIEFAATRFSELSLDPTLPNEDVRGPGPRRPDRVVAPVPTSAFAPPPNTSESHGPPEPSAAPARASASRLPGSDCAQTCGEKWNACRATCKDRACDPCDKAYRACMPACFHEEPAAGRPAKSAR